MKGGRPSACKARNRFGLREAGVFLPDIGSIGLSFPRGPGGFCLLDAGYLFALIGSAIDRSGKRRPSVRDLKNGASPSLA